MGFLDAGYALFEFTGQKILDFYDILSSAPAIVKIFQNNTTKVYYCSFDVKCCVLLVLVKMLNISYVEEPKEGEGSCREVLDSKAWHSKEQTQAWYQIQRCT